MGAMVVISQNPCVGFFNNTLSWIAQKDFELKAILDPFILGRNFFGGHLYSKIKFSVSTAQICMAYRVPTAMFTIHNKLYFISICCKQI